MPSYGELFLRDYGIVEEGIIDNYKRATVYNDITRAVGYKYTGKNFSNINECVKSVVRDLGISKIYGEYPAIVEVTTSSYGGVVETDYSITVFGFRKNELVSATWTVNKSFGDSSVSFNPFSVYIGMHPIAEKNKTTKLLFDVLDKCTHGTINNVYVKDNTGTIRFNFADRSKVQSIANKFGDKVEYKNNLSIRKKRCSLLVHLD